MTALDSLITPISQFLGYILVVAYSVIPSLGVAIIILTLLVMMALFPLTAKQTKSMLAMQRIQPQIKALQAKYKGDKQKLNEEMMRFYQENKVNPLAGCWPLLVQMPILFALFRLMTDPQKFIPSSSKLYSALCGSVDSVACKVAITENGFPSALDFLGLNLHFSAKDVKGGFLVALPYFILVLASIAAQFFQSVQQQRGQTEINTQMKIVSRVIPLVFGVFSLGFPAGVVLYWLFSALARIGQQEFILRKITLPARAEMAAKQEESGSSEPDDYQSRRTQKRKKK